MSCELLTSLATPTSSYVTGGGRGEGEGEEGPDNLPLRFTPTTPSRTPIVRNTTLHTTPTNIIVTV